MNRTALLVLGDALVFLSFAAIGRQNHGDREGGIILGALGTATPFLLAWFALAWLLHAFHTKANRTAARAARTAIVVWIPALLIALAVRSALEGHLTPLPFALVAFLFNGVLLVGWRSGLAAIWPP